MKIWEKRNDDSPIPNLHNRGKIHSVGVAIIVNNLYFCHQQ